MSLPVVTDCTVSAAKIAIADAVVTTADSVGEIGFYLSDQGV